MFFFFKEKKLIIDAFVHENNKHVYDYAKLDYARSFYPEWWKNLEKPKFDWEGFGMPTNMKFCSGIIDHYKQGIVMPLWSDLAIKTNETSITSIFSDQITPPVSWHPAEIRNNVYKDFFNIKIQSPWLIKSDKNIMFNFLPTFWNKNSHEGYEVVPGTINFYYQHGTNINMFVPIKKNNITINFGQPLLHIVPLTERKIELKNHLISEKEWSVLQTKSGTPLSFSKKFITLKRAIDKNDEMPKCPFHWK